MEGVRANLELMQKYYPGWIARLYIDYEIEDPIIGRLCSLACQYSFLDICHVKDLPGTPFIDGSKIFPMTWRYFPTLDPQVTAYLLLVIIMTWNLSIVLNLVSLGRFVCIKGS